MTEHKVNKPNSSKFKDFFNKDIKISMFKKLKIDRFYNKTYMGKKVISMDMGSSSIKVVIGKRDKKKITIYDAFIIPLAEGEIVDGFLVNESKLINIIKNQLNSRGCNIKDVIFTSNSTSIINRELALPKAEEKELKTLVNFEIQKYLPINLNDYIVQYNVLGEFIEENLPKYKLLVVTYPYKMAKEYFKLCNDCELRPIALDITFNSVNKLLNKFNIINGQEVEKNETVAFIDMGNESLNIHIYKNGNLNFTRTIRAGGAQLDEAILRSYKITEEEAKRKKEKSFSLTKENINSLEHKEFVENLITYLDEWVEEIQRIFQFYKNKNVGNKINKVFIYGGTSKINGMNMYLQEKLNVPVFNIKTIDGIECLSELAMENLDLYLNAIGAIIRL